MAYDYAPNPDKQWILQFTGRMHDIHLKFTDVLMTKRLQTLQTLDESVQRIINKLEALGELDNTYVFYTSDHGYHLGQFGLVKGKSMPFEFDIKVPFLVRGPGIRPGTQINNIALNVDLAPTFLDIAGIKAPPHMDGRSLMPLLRASAANEKVEGWRDSFLIESSGRIREEDALELRKERREQRARDLSLLEGGLFTSKHERLELVCKSTKYSSPCGPIQKWECVHDGFRWRLRKCRMKNGWRRRNCVCERDLGMGFLVKLDSEERRKQRLFLKKHASQDIKKFDPKFLRAFSDVDSSEVAEETLGRVQRNSRWSQGQQKRKNRQRRDVLEDIPDPVDPDFEDLEKVIPSEVKDNVEAFVNEEEMRAIDDKITTLSDELEGLETVSSTSATSLAPGNDSLISHDMTDVDSSQLGHGCRATETSVDCTEEVYQDPHAWKVSKTAIDDQIRRLRHQLYVLKHVRKHLRNTRPNTLVTLEDYDYPESGESGFGPDFSSLDEILSNSGDHSSFAAEVSDFRDSSQRRIFPLDTGTHSGTHTGTLFINVEDTGQDSPNNKTKHRDEGEATFTEDGEDVFEDVGSAEIDYDHIGMTPIAVDESSEVVIHSPAAVDESSEVVIQEGEDIIYGRDYDVDSDRGYSHSKNYMSGRRRSKGKKEKFDVFHHSSYNKARNKNRNKKNNRKNDDNDTTLDINGVRISSSDILSGRGRSESTLQFQFYPARESVPGRRQPSVIDNETSPTQPICWCDKKMAAKLAIQQERARKRAERQKVKLERLKRKEQKMRRKLRKSKDALSDCNPLYSNLNCYYHDNDHWKTPPLWHDGKFCYCMNAPNNTYWCLRTINDTHNYLYCEFITGLVTYYDLNIDPYQLRNVAFTLSNSRVAELHHRLEKLRVCVGASQCDDIPDSQRIGEESADLPSGGDLTRHSIMNNAVLPVRRQTKVERMQEREERRRLRKASKKYRRKKLYDVKNKHVLDAVGSGEHKVRIPRKSRIEKERRRERQRERRERKRKKKSRKNRNLLRN